MDAIGLLEQDHQGAKKAMEKIMRSSGSEKKALFEALKQELELHDHIEENIFYPGVKAHAQGKDPNFGAQDKRAHEEVEATLAQLARLPIEDPQWSPAFSAMQAKLLKHVSDEEGEVFVKIRQALSATQLSDLGSKMKAYKEQQLKAA